VKIEKETSVIPEPQAQNSHPCEVWINKPVPSPEALPVDQELGKPISQ